MLWSGLSHRNFPFKTMVALGLLSFLTVERDPKTKQLHWTLGLTTDTVRRAEFYPFSSFSMYSDFSERPFYVWLSDQEGKPFPSKELNVKASQIKKIYERKLKLVSRQLKEQNTLQTMDLALKRQCGLETLQVLRESTASAKFAQRYHGLRLTLHEVTITLQKGRLVENDLVIAHES